MYQMEHVAVIVMGVLVALACLYMAGSYLVRRFQQRKEA
jgi:flagellar biogenesis protein FliO